jgi:carboxyl-terminal processing protease
VTEIDGQWVVTAIQVPSSAEAAGVTAGWILQRINGVEFTGRSSCGLNERQTMEFADVDGQQRRVEVTCRLNPPASTRPSPRVVRTLDEGVIYLRFDSFAPGADGWLAEQLRGRAVARPLILDLRYNDGGNIDVVRRSLDLLFAQPFVAGEFISRNGNRSAFRIAGSRARAYSAPVALLIGEGTGSGGELFAAAVNDSARGKLIGRTTRGQLLLAKDYDLGHGFTATVPHHDYRTAAGIRIESRGVAPNVPVPLTLADFRQGRDADLERARELFASSQVGR